MSTKEKVLRKYQLKPSGKVVPFERGWYVVIANKTGVSLATIYRVMGDRSRAPSWELACKIADAMGITLDQLRDHLRKWNRRAA